MAAGGDIPAARDCIPGTDCDCGGARCLTLGDIARSLEERREMISAPAATLHEARFDQRPGYLEATRDLSGGEIYVVGARLEGADWGVLLMVRGADGVAAQSCVTPERAYALARDIERMADIAAGAVLP